MQDRLLYLFADRVRHVGVCGESDLTLLMDLPCSDVLYLAFAGLRGGIDEFREPPRASDERASPSCAVGTNPEGRGPRSAAFTMS